MSTQYTLCQCVYSINYADFSKNHWEVYTGTSNLLLALVSLPSFPFNKCPMTLKYFKNFFKFSIKHYFNELSSCTFTKRMYSSYLFNEKKTVWCRLRCVNVTLDCYCKIGTKLFETHKINLIVISFWSIRKGYILWNSWDSSRQFTGA